VLRLENTNLILQYIWVMDNYNLIKKIIKAIGDDPEREGLLDTPKRVVKSWDTIFGGYKQKPKDILNTQFTEDYKSMVVCKDIEFYSTCEHHMLPFYGKCHIGYVPHKRVVGLSKLPRLLDAYARRLQIQERLSEQVADSIMKYLDPLGVGVIIHAKHHCILCRGVAKQNSSMVTSSIRGIFQEAHIKEEFHRLING